jgi:transglutaminase-like putative cysteine protease
VDVAQVGCAVGFDVTEPAEIVLRIAVADPATETLTVSAGGHPIEAVELPGRQHYIRVPAGPVSVNYSAEVRPAPADCADPQRKTYANSLNDPVTEIERIEALRPSRYCPSDRLGGFAVGQFGGVADPGAIASWVFEHLSYQVGSSTVTTDAIDTLLAGAGVCRDYAHLTATLCRALNIPARVAAVYAPGLSPMDFHLVVETAIDGRWRVWDATRLAPRPTLIRIATGRDAADTALATTLSGALTLTDLLITAVAADDLPVDDHRTLIRLA